jgi:hypothetical protein
MRQMACQFCATPLPPPKYPLSPSKMRRRKYCDRDCASNHRQAKIIARGYVNRNGNPLPARLTIPDSARRVATAAGIPQRCECGGLWRRVLDGVGVACLSCGRDIWISAALVGL